MEGGSETSSIKKRADDPALDSRSVLNVGKATTPQGYVIRFDA
jgi:hypothetical protein